jgi:hypothetical protein
MQGAEYGTSQNDDESFDLTEQSDSSLRTKKLAMAAIFASLSIIITPIAAFIPRIPGWNIALFDPVSFFWLIAFLLGGGWVGLVSMVAGAIALNFFDPTPFFGPLLKFVATLPLIVIPWLGVKYHLKKGMRAPFPDTDSAEESKGDLKGGRILSRLTTYLPLMFIAFLIRLILMIPLNLMIVPLLWGLDDFGFIVTYTVILNTFQTLFDIILPYVVIHRTTIFENFKLW